MESKGASKSASAAKSCASSRAVGSPDSGSTWVALMRHHFHCTGAYRAEDLQRLLGDQRKSVGMTASSDVQIASFLFRK